MISKDEILVALWAKSPIIWGLTLFSAALTGIYMFRLLFLTFFGNFRGTEEQKHHLHESPISMTLPLVVLAVLSVVGGFINLPHFIGHGEYQNLAHWLEPLYVYGAKHAEVPFNIEMILLAITLVMVAAVFFIVRNIYVTKNKMAQPEENYKGWERLSAKKLLIDELYNATVVKPVEGLGKGTRMFDKLMDRFFNFVGFGAVDSGRAFKKFQNGNVENYVLIMSLAIGLILIVNFLLQ
jgi:NADH-quinone oxidoreductase subunit L